MTGADWPKSACTYCPFALCSTAGRERVLAAYRAEPAAGVHALLLEHIAVSLNPRQGLAAGERLSGLLAATGQHHDVLSAFAASLDRMPWRVYEVRRVIRPRAGDPARAANASRSLHAVAAGSRTQMTERAWLRRRGAALRAAEHFLVAAPAGPQDKGRPRLRCRLAGGDGVRRRHPARAGRPAARAPPHLDRRSRRREAARCLRRPA